MVQNLKGLKITNREAEILHHLISKEMAGICGDLGYEELSRIRTKLDEFLSAYEDDIKPSSETASGFVIDKHDPNGL